MAMAANVKGLDFGALLQKLPPPSELPTLETYEARDGTQLQYRRYTGDSDIALILAHGSGTDNKYWARMSRAIAESGAATVYTPNLRGHGPSPVRRGDIDYVDQLVDDLVDLISRIETTRNEIDTVVVGGHSSGGGLAVRFAGSSYRSRADAYLLLAPYLGHDAPTTRQNSGGWAEPDLFRIIPISMLNAVGITYFNSTQVLHFNMPPEYRDGSETLAYSYRLMQGFSPSDFKAALQSIQVPILLVIGSSDHALLPDQFEPTLRPLVPQAIIQPVNGASHLGLVVNGEATDVVRRWLEQL